MGGVLWIACTLNLNPKPSWILLKMYVKYGLVRVMLKVTPPGLKKGRTNRNKSWGVWGGDRQQALEELEGNKLKANTIVPWQLQTNYNIFRNVENFQIDTFNRISRTSS